MTTEKLLDPPIVETVLEVRFETASEMPEFTTVRLTEIELWKSGTRTRLPTADIPSTMRSQQPALLQHLPVIEIRGVEGIGSVRVGPNVLSIHFVAPYAGWESIVPTMEPAVEDLFAILPGLRVTRLGLRYINVFTAARHHVKSVDDLTLSVAMKGAPLAPINLLFTASEGPSHTVATRVVSRDFLEGNVPADGTLLVDIDVSTPAEILDNSATSVKRWIYDAHTLENNAFRRLLPDPLFERLRNKTHASH